jgi:acyl dehydratase
MDAGMTFARPITDRYFEDYVEGDVHHFGTIAVEADELIAFAKRFDPQAMHTDPEAAKNTPCGQNIGLRLLSLRSRI